MHCRSGHPTAGGSSSRRTARACSNLYSQAADGTGAADRLTTSANQQCPSSITPDGTLSSASKHVVAAQPEGARRCLRIRLYRLAGRAIGRLADRRWRPPARPCSTEPGRSSRPTAATSRTSRMSRGRSRSTCDRSRRWTAAAGRSRRRRDTPRVGAERSRAVLPRCIEYAHRGAGPDLRIDVQRGQAGEGVRRQVSTPYPPRQYDVSPDGQRFLMIKDSAAGDPNTTPASMVVVEHWFEELKQRVATNGK